MSKKNKNLSNSFNPCKAQLGQFAGDMVNISTHKLMQHSSVTFKTCALSALNHS